MSFILLQSPHSPYAGNFDALVAWSGIYYDQRHNAGPLENAVVVCDCHEFARISQWRDNIAPDCLVVALLDYEFNISQLESLQPLFMVLPTGLKPELLRKNLQLANALLRRQLLLREKLLQTERQMEDMSLIGQAKKWLMGQWQLSEEQAHRWLQRQSQVKQQKLIVTARQIMQGHYPGRPVPANETDNINHKPVKP